MQHDLLDGELWGIATYRASRPDDLLSLKEIIRACVLLCASLKPATRCACSAATELTQTGHSRLPSSCEPRLLSAGRKQANCACKL